MLAIFYRSFRGGGGAALLWLGCFLFFVCCVSGGGGGGSPSHPPTHSRTLYTLACKVESSVQERVGGIRSREPAWPGTGATVRTFSLLVWKMFGMEVQETEEEKF